MSLFPHTHTYTQAEQCRGTYTQPSYTPACVRQDTDFIYYSYLSIYIVHTNTCHQVNTPTCSYCTLSHYYYYTRCTCTPLLFTNIAAVTAAAEMPKFPAQTDVFGTDIFSQNTCCSTPDKLLLAIRFILVLRARVVVYGSANYSMCVRCVESCER